MSRQPEPLSAESSRLCRSCGLCCQGILHRKGVLEEAEVPRVRALGLRIENEEGKPFFGLPCPAHAGDKCTVYAGRPQACAGYRCQLLRRLAAGETTWEESLEIVQQARQMLADLRGKLGLGPGEDLWSRLPEPGSSAGDASPLLLMDAATLRIFCRRHFEIAAQPLQMVPE